MTPQFSIYTEMPAALHMYNIFRSRWVGAYYQAQGLHVIPTVYWGLPQSYWFCFDGIEKGSTVAVTTLGVRKEKDFFLQGYNEMLRRIEPENIICYCEPFPEMKGNLIIVDYAQTNHLSPARKLTNTSSCYIVKKTGYVIRDGFGSAGGGGPGSSSTGNTSSGSARDSLPENAQKVLQKYEETGWKGNIPGQTSGTCAGGKYYNWNGQLPGKDAKGKEITYREFDVNNKISGKRRDVERFVVGSDGTVYYTNGHYDKFIKIK